MSSTKSTTQFRRATKSDIRNHVQIIVSKFQPEKVILFGSYAKGNITPASDIDLLVIMNSDKSTFDLAVEIAVSLKHTIPIDIIVRTPQEINRRLEHGDFFIKNIIETGKVLYERIC